MAAPEDGAMLGVGVPNVELMPSNVEFDGA